MKRVYFFALLGSVVQNAASQGALIRREEVKPSSTSLWPPYQPTNAPMFQLSSDPHFAFYLEEVLALANNGGANTGEVLRIAAQIVPKDMESTYTAFNYMADHIYAIAEGINVTNDPVSARDAYFRAATYYRGADFFLLGNWSDPRNYDLWDKSLNSFDKAIGLLNPVPGERFSVKAHSPSIGNFDAIGVFYKAALDNKRKPTVVVGSGYDGSQEESYHSYIRQIIARGLNAVTYEGPGQPTVRRKQSVGFIPDWWNVVTPVVDYLSTRQDVDMSKLALMGISFGGTLAPIAASQEHRFKAVVALDGLPSMRQAVAELLPASILDIYASGNKSYFDAVLHSIARNASNPTSFRWLIDQSLWSFNTQSPFDWWTAFEQMSWTNETVKDIPMHVLIGKNENDDQTAGQPELAYEMMTTGRPNGKDLTYYHMWNTSLGAGEHCGLGAESQLAQVILDWLSTVWGGTIFENHFI